MAEVKAGGAAKASPQLSGQSANKRESKSNSLKAPLNGTAAGAAAPSQSVFDSKDYVAGKDNVWQLMLQKASRKAAFPNATMVVIGDKKNGKTALLNKFGERVHNAQTAEYVMDYSYVPVKNRYNADKEEVLGALNVFQWDEPAHADVLQHFARSHGLDNSIYVLTVSLAEPWNVIRSVTTWLNVLVSQHTKILDALPADDRKRLKEKIAAYTQLYVDPSVKKKQQSGDLKSSAATAGELEAAKAAINLNIPKFNIGVPIVIVGTKAEVLSKKASKAAGSDDRFEFLTRRLRKIALDYGATLMYTSAAGAGLNTELLQDYVYHRLYNFPLEAPAKAVVSVANDDLSLYVPAGYDSVELIDPVASAAAGKDKDVVISVGSWTEATPMEEVFADNAEQKQKAASKVAEEVTAPDNASFYRMLQQSMEKDTVRGAGGMAGLSINPNSLSTTGASGAQPGVTGRQSLQIPVSPSAHSGRSAADRATLDKLNALRQAAGGSSAAAGQRTPTHSQSTRDLHSVNSTPSGGAGVGPAQGTPSGAGATAKPGAAGAGAAVGGAAATGSGAAGKTDMKKTAVKAFFKSLLNGAPSGAAGTTVTTAASSTSLRTAARDTLGGGNQ